MNKFRDDSHNEQNEGKRKRFFSPQGKIIDTFVHDWYLKCIKENQPVSGRLIKEKALEIAHNIHYVGFSASNGWLQRWRLRHNVNLKPASRSETMHNGFIEHFDKYMEHGTVNYKLKNKFNPAYAYLNKNSWKSSKSETYALNSTKNYINSNQPTFNRANHDDDYFDPLAFSEASFGDIANHDVDDDIISISENESHFKVDSYAAALIAIEDLKNFAQDDDVALKYLRQIECHFQKERLK